MSPFLQALRKRNFLLEVSTTWRPEHFWNARVHGNLCTRAWEPHQITMKFPIIFQVFICQLSLSLRGARLKEIEGSQWADPDPAPRKS